MPVVIVEGESDRVALEVLARRSGVQPPTIAVVGGAGGARRAVEGMPGQTVLGLVDANERIQFESVIEHVFVCDPDLEGELIRALGIPAVEAVIESQGELESFRRLQRQPAQRGRSVEAHLARFFGGRSGNKLRYARLLAEAVSVDRIPEPLAALIRAADTAENADDERWLVIDGRRWRRTDPSLPEYLVNALKVHLGRARSAVRIAKRNGDEAAVAAARTRVGLAKRGLGERGPYWWDEPEEERRKRAQEALRKLDELP